MGVVITFLPLLELQFLAAVIKYLDINVAHQPVNKPEACCNNCVSNNHMQEQNSTCFAVTFKYVLPHTKL